MTKGKFLIRALLPVLLLALAGCALAPAGETLSEEEVDRFFDDAAFIGDSISVKLQNYHAQTGCFGNAVFLTAGSYSVHHGVEGSMFLVFRGQQLTPGQALQACGAKKVFILLGMNDVGYYGIEPTMEKWEQLVKDIRAACPGIEVYIQSGTPIFPEGEKTKLTNAVMDAYNDRLREFAKAKGCHYVDIATAMKDESGGLRADFCSDAYVHLTDQACEAWVEVLRTYVKGNGT